MTTKRKPYKPYTKEFRLEALRLMDESDRPARKGRPKKGDQTELATVKQDLKRVKEENEILKKAAVFFAKQLD